MDPRAKDADEALEKFRASRTIEGRFLSYCRGRTKYFWTRQVIVLALFPAVFLIGDPMMVILAAIVAVLGDAIDSYILNRFARRTALAERLPLAIGLTSFTGGIQTAANAFAILTISMLGDGDTRVLAGAACFAGILDSALLFTSHRAASIIKIMIYLVCTATIVLHEWLQRGMTDTSLPFDVLSIALLLYVCLLVVRHFFRTHHRVSNSRLRTLEYARELAHSNAALVQSRQTARRLALIAENANDSVIVTDRNGKITWVNKAFTQVTGYSHAEALGRNVTFLNGSQTDNATSKALQKARADTKPIRLEIVNHHKDGRPIWMDVNMNPLFDETGEFMNFVSIERDIGEAKEREQALAKARGIAEESVRARRNFLATMSHEIRTPMNGVIGTTELLLETDLDQQQEYLVRTISSSGDSLLAIINDILDFSRLEDGKLEVNAEPFSPGRCFQSAVDLVRPLADAKKLQLKLALPSSLPTRLIGDERRLSQVLLNLLGNAIKFTETGSVNLDVSVRLVDGSCNLLFAVRDTGIGIEASKQNRIFESFVQADARVAGVFGGSGLGLSISRLLLKAMGGEISVASEPGTGSVFFVSLTLPVAEPQKVTAPLDHPTPVLPQPRVDFDDTRILIAEDNRTNKMLLERMLADTNATLIFAGNGREAADLFVDHAPDIVLMDLHMPILNGLAATSLIRETEAKTGATPVPVLALTASAFPEDKELCISSGMDGIITKPFRKRDLLGAISSTLTAHRRPLPRDHGPLIA